LEFLSCALLVGGYCVDAKAFRSHAIDCSQEQGIITLEPGSPLERELLGTEKHTYRLTLAEGQYASLIVEQRGIDVVARLFGTDEKLVFEFDTELRRQGVETPEIVAETSGTYRLEIEPRYKLLPPGRYEIRLNQL